MDDQEFEPGTVDFGQHAGLVVFPRSADELTDTTLCPACFTPLPGTVCESCGLDLGHPAAFQLLRHSQDAAQLLRARVTTIGRMRYETAQQRARRETPAEAIPDTGADPADPLAPGDADSAARDTGGTGAEARGGTETGGRPPKRASTAPASSGPRRSSIQVLLLLVGVSLLSIATIFFLVYAFLTYGLITRSIIIGAITIAAFVVTGLLRRRGLAATAEGIGTFAVVLIYLDAFAVRANDLLALGSVPGTTYWGITFVVSAVAFIAWQRRTGPRSASIAAFATFAPGVGLVVAGADPAPGGHHERVPLLRRGGRRGHHPPGHRGGNPRQGRAPDRAVDHVPGAPPRLPRGPDAGSRLGLGARVRARTDRSHRPGPRRDSWPSAAPPSRRQRRRPQGSPGDGRASRIFGAAFAGFAGAASALALVAVADPGRRRRVRQLRPAGGRRPAGPDLRVRLAHPHRASDARRRPRRGARCRRGGGDRAAAARVPGRSEHRRGAGGKRLECLGPGPDRYGQCRRGGSRVGRRRPRRGRRAHPRVLAAVRNSPAGGEPCAGSRWARSSSPCRCSGCCGWCCSATSCSPPWR